VDNPKAMKKVTALAVVLVALVTAGYSQATSGHGITSRVKPHQVGPNDGFYIRLGPPFRERTLWDVQAPKHRCIVKRTVVLYFNRQNKRHRVDSERTASDGTVVLRGSWHHIPRREIVLVRNKRVVKPGNDYTCSHDRWRWTFWR
jgi:hypothetical protein